MQYNDHVLRQRRQILLDLDFFELSNAVIKRAQCNAAIARIDQAVVADDRVPLNPPIAKHNFIRPGEAAAKGLAANPRQ